MITLILKRIMMLAVILGATVHLNAQAGDTINTLQYLDRSVTSYIYSLPNANYTLRMMADGTLTMVRADGVIRWKTVPGGDAVVMQTDGNFVQYQNPGIALWATMTNNGQLNHVTIHDDGDLVVYTPGNQRIWNLGSDPVWGDPVKVGDVLGRDLADTYVGFLGHLGIWDGQQVFQVTGGQNNAVNIVDLFSFKHTKTQAGTDASYWGTVSFNVPSGTIFMYGCWEPYCPVYGSQVTADARWSIALHAMLTYRIGADYTIYAQYTRARPAWPGQAPTRGVYRCDTFVIDTLITSTFFDNSVTPTPAQQQWINRWNSLNSGTVTPPNVYSTLKTYQ